MSERERPTILVVDDDPDLLASCRKILARAGYTVHLAGNGAEACDLIAQVAPHVVLADIRMPRMDGVGLLREITANSPKTLVIIMTAFGTVERAVETMKGGAFDFLTKPFSAEQLLNAVERAESRVALAEENRNLRNALAEVGERDGIIGRSPAMRALLEQIASAAGSNGSVLVLGESGTGKELVARAIHAHSLRRNGPFVALNCGALPDHLVESELFGHEKGAFTGAHEKRPGLLESANSGVFFLDEIGDLPLHLQPKLLRALEERRVRRVGGRQEVPIDVRVISATNRRAEMLLGEGLLREDLYYRLNTFSLTVPPLRERNGDVALLAMHFLDLFSRECEKHITGFADEVLERLTAYRWPGNVRQLQHVIERAVALCEGDRITLADLPRDLQGSAAPQVADDADAVLYDMPLPEARQQVLDSFERRYLMRLLSRYSGNVRQASLSLGMERKSLYRLLERHNINPDDFRD